MYDNGQACPKGSRSTSVRYMCGTAKEIVSIIEPKECSYEMVVTHPSLCGAGSPFTVYSGQQVASELKTTDDHWFMSLEKSVAGHYVCSAFVILRDVKENAQVCFSKFGLQVYDDKEGPISVKQGIGRHFGRVPLHKTEYEIVKGDKHSYALVSTKKFTGSLEFARVIFSDE